MAVPLNDFKTTMTTMFWVGEQADAENAYIPNHESYWDKDWLASFGGVDDPWHRNGHWPAGFAPKENPFYVALPYGEFAEQNLGTVVAADGSVTTRIIATQFMFAPHCVAVPQGRPVTLRLASPDVIHGILVTGTNVNTMIIPGYVSQVHTVFTRTGDLLMPCHEYCGLGHSQMWATVKVVPEAEFKPGADGRATCDVR